MTVPAATQPSNSRAQVRMVQSQPKINVVYHNLPRCVVSGARIDGGRQKVEIVYTVGSTENHIYVANQSSARRFNQNPQLYMQKLSDMEKSPQ